MLKVVLDTNVLVSGIFFGGGPQVILRAWLDKRFQLYVTPDILTEYVRVITQLGHQKNRIYERDYVYHIAFDDGINGAVDLSGYLDLGYVFAPLKDKEFFKSARVEGGTIAWPNGADIAPETLYARLEGQK